jgi:anti-sigma-K factor RskA
MMDHREANELIEAYAFGTLEEEQVRKLEEHLESGCEECLARLREASELSVRLAQAVPQSDPAPQVEERLFRRIGEESRHTGAGRVRKLHFPIWTVAAAAVILLGLAIGTGYLVYQNENLRHDLTEAADVTSLLNSPGMKFVDLSGVDPNPQAFGKVVLDPDKGAAVVYMYRLPQTPEGMEYQLWVMREGKPTNAGLFTVAPDGSAMLALEDLGNASEIDSFLVTIEPAGGQATPTGMMYLTGPNVFQSEN